MSEWAVPGYTELRELGSGGFGSVVLARHDATGTPVAIKYLRSDLASDPYLAELFRSEAITLGSLDDPHVTRLYEYVEGPDGAAIVMELVDGVTLREVLTRYGKTSPEAALVVLYGSLLGLAAAHARGVVHRDYKPANVLVNAHGASKLTDFGIAVLAGTDLPTGATAAYAPPEQWDAAPATPASDVYAATVTFYECLTGQRPFTGQSDTTLAEQHRHASIPMEPVPQPLRTVVARGMAKDPEYRPADAGALAAELRAVAAGAYGEDWERRGRSQLGQAALLLAALWPTAGAPALQGTTIEQARLHQGAQGSHGAHGAQGSQSQPTAHASQAAQGSQGSQSQPVSRAERHRWHLRHVRHEEHLEHLRYVSEHDGNRASGPRKASRIAKTLRTTSTVVTAGAVVAAIGTVAATSGSRSPGAGAHPLAVAYQETAAVLPATVATGFAPLFGDVFVRYGDGSGAHAEIKGSVAGGTAGMSIRLFAQRFPFTSAPALAGSVTLNPAAGGAGYAFTVTPTIATRYQVKLFASASASAPLASSVISTIYVLGYSRVVRDTGCVGAPVCHATVVTAVEDPPAGIQASLNDPWYAYLGITVGPAGSHIADPTSMQLGLGDAASSVHRTGDDSLSLTLTFSYNVGNDAYSLQYADCTKGIEAKDGLGLPGPHGCGDERVSATTNYLG